MAKVVSVDFNYLMESVVNDCGGRKDQQTKAQLVYLNSVLISKNFESFDNEKYQISNKLYKEIKDNYLHYVDCLVSEDYVTTDDFNLYFARIKGLDEIYNIHTENTFYKLRTLRESDYKCIIVGEREPKPNFSVRDFTKLRKDEWALYGINDDNAIFKKVVEQ